MTGIASKSALLGSVDGFASALRLPGKSSPSRKLIDDRKTRLVTRAWLQLIARLLCRLNTDDCESSLAVSVVQTRPKQRHVLSEQKKYSWAALSRKIRAVGHKVLFDDSSHEPLGPSKLGDGQKRNRFAYWYKCQDNYPQKLGHEPRQRSDAPHPMWMHFIRGRLTLLCYKPLP